MMKLRENWFAFLLIFLLLTGCNFTGQQPETPLPGSALGNFPPGTGTPPALQPGQQPRATLFPTPTSAPTITLVPTATTVVLNLTQSVDPFAQYTILALRGRSYGGGAIENIGQLGKTKKFIRYSFRYPSDGLNIRGFMNVPLGTGPYPIILVLHGYSDPSGYVQMDYTTDTADHLADQGYIVIHPDYRNYFPSNSGDALFRVGYAVDVLNLLEIIKSSSGQAGLLKKADASRIGIWAHSMGGAIALKVAVISHDVKGIFLYSSMSGNDYKNSRYFGLIEVTKDGVRELTASPEQFAAISPETYYPDITAAIQIHHGTADSVIPIAWAKETCQKLKDAGVKTDCFYYDGAEHTFLSRYMSEFQPRMDAFFSSVLK